MMSDSIVKHEQFEYSETMPFQIRKPLTNMEEHAAGYLSSHWHEELEIVYGVTGNCLHYINGECVVGGPGRLITTNSEFIHSIIMDPKYKDQKLLSGIVIIIHPRFIEENFPEYKNLYFTNEKEQASDEIRQIIQKLVDYANGMPVDAYGHLYAKGLLLELLYYMCQEGTVKREVVDDVNQLKDIERMKGVLAFINDHYAEPLSQAQVAGKFHFSTVYFSRYFKKCVGNTFTEYLMGFRLKQVRLGLLQTDKSVTQIALENGFTDERRLIIAFKKKFDTTPLQYRKNAKHHK